MSPDNDPLDEADTERPPTLAEREQEERYARRFYGRKYGLMASETTRLLACRRLDLLHRELDDWREKNGFLGAACSGPVRGHLMDLVRSGRFD